MASARGPKQSITSAWSRVKKDLLLPDSVLKAAGKAAATAQIDVIRQRALAQIGPDGKRFRRNSKEWTKTKRGIMSGKIKYPEWKKKTALRMTDPSQVGRLTGRTIADMTFGPIRTKRSGSSIDISWVLQMRNTRRVGRATSAEIVEHLKRMRINLFGATQVGPYKKKEEDVIKNVLRKYLSLNPGASHTLKID